MKINGTIFSKPQQDQLKRGIGTELDKVVAKVDDVDKRMLNYMGDWASGNEYHENDVVTWGTDGHLYEVIKAHTSSATFNPDNPEYYKAMTVSKLKSFYFRLTNTSGVNAFIRDNFERIVCVIGEFGTARKHQLNINYDNNIANFSFFGHSGNVTIIDWWYSTNGTSEWTNYQRDENGVLKGEVISGNFVDAITIYYI